MRFIRTFLLVSLAALVAAPLALAIRFTDEDFNLPIAQTGKTYSFQLTGAGGCGPALPYQWTLLGSSMPPGLTLDSSGLIHGTPTTAGNYSFWVDLSDQNPPSQSWCRPSDAQRMLSLTVVQGLSIVQRQSTLTPAQLNTPYNMQLSAAGAGSSPLTWSVASGSLPAGLTLNSSTGLISGTPTALGDSSFRITVTDGTRQDTQTYGLSVVQPLKITSPASTAAEVGRPFQYTLTAEGGRTAYSWSATGLPPGLSLDVSTGAITGTPAAVVQANVLVTLTDSLGLQSQQTLHLAVANTLQLVRHALPTAHAGKPYRARMYVTGGVAPKRFTIAGGSLPAGLHLNGRTGWITGVPRKTGTSRVTISVTDRLGAASRASFKLKVS